jgi:hypothetical protein
VLQGLRDTPVMIDGKPMRMLDEVDTLSGVSGGSFPAAYYGLFGDLEKARQLSGIEGPDHLVVIVVNAENEPDPAIDPKAAAPSLAASLNLISGSQIRRYNFESLLLVRQAVEELAETFARASHRVRGHFVEVSFDLAPAAEERRYLKRRPTSFQLGDEPVDRLIAAGRQLLARSPADRALVEQLQ